MAGEESIDLIRDLAEKTWTVSYRDMISAEQISYMLDMMYSRESLLRQMSEGIRFLIHYTNDEPSGFAGFGPRLDTPSVWRLEKLYVLPSLQHKGSGKRLLEKAMSTASSAGAEKMELNVNRNNPAVTFYQKIGFTISHEADIDIGGGFYMNDFIMVKQLDKPSA